MAGSAFGFSFFFFFTSFLWLLFPLAILNSWLGFLSWYAVWRLFASKLSRAADRVLAWRGGLTGAVLRQILPSG